MQAVSLSGSLVKVYISGSLFTNVQSVNYTIDYGINEIGGVDSPFPQEVVPTRISVTGTISGLVIKGAGGLQGAGVTSKIIDVMNQSYVSIRIVDRHTDQNLLFVAQAMITNESVSVSAKGLARSSFGFKGIVPLQSGDLGQ